MNPASPIIPAPTRAAGLDRLADFVSQAGRAYSEGRNVDLGPGARGAVSGLSAHVRHRLVLEAELVEAVVAAHGLRAADVFVQEACWRTYWKGWLDRRPSVWSDYRSELARDLASLDRDPSLLNRYEAAVAGRAGLACADAWARELVETGYLHNHARMWFASIWIYTFGLPWTLGADFFLRHLLDGDPASNTLSWRWVCGLQTEGKTYLARADNIARFTGGRFRPSPSELAAAAPPLTAAAPRPAAGPVDPGDIPEPDAPTLLLVHEEDGYPESGAVGLQAVRAVVGLPPVVRSPLLMGSGPFNFTAAAVADALGRAERAFDAPGRMLDSLETLLDVARAVGARQIVTHRPDVGPLRDRFEALRPRLGASGIVLVLIRRPWDLAFHPHAEKGFFYFKTQIPSVLGALGLAPRTTGRA